MIISPPRPCVNAIRRIQVEYYVAADYKVDNFHITVRRPILTPEERDRRMKRIHNSAAALMLSIWQAEEKKKGAK